MPSPVKISDTLLAQARAEAAATHRSATAQIEHWATIGRAVEALVAYRDVLALKRAGETLPLPAHVGRDDVRAVLARVLGDDARQAATARIRAAGGSIYAADPDHPGLIVEIRPDGTRTRGHMAGRRFVPGRRKTTGAR